MSYSNRNPAWDRMVGGQAAAADQQPWRCAECGEPVSRVNNSDCRCTRAWKAENGEVR